jgi:hypothetical protein
MASLCPKGELWRSKKMQLVQLIVQNDAAHAVMSHLGELGKMQMRDVRSPTAASLPCAPVAPRLVTPTPSPSVA